VRTRGWETMRAVHERRVYCIRDEFLNTPAPTLLEGLRALAAAIHPGMFPPPAGLRQLQWGSPALSDQPVL
jgi:iron complex transport system substrate-binding protein